MNKTYEIIYRVYPYSPEDTKTVTIQAQSTEKAYQIFLESHKDVFITTFTQVKKKHLTK